MSWTISDEDLDKTLPNCARGLQVLLVDHDIPSLTSLSSMLQRYTFNVTAVQTTMAAISVVRDWQRDQRDCLKVVMAHLNLVNPEHLSFLRTLVRKAVPIILISSDKDVSNGQKALYEGAAFFYQKPIPLADLKYVWQFAYPKKTSNKGKDHDPPVEVKRKRNSVEVLPSVISNDCNNKTEAVPNGETNQTLQVVEGSCSKYVPQPLVIEQEVRKAEPPSLQKVMKRPFEGGNDSAVTSIKKLNIGAVKVDKGKPEVVETGKQEVGGKGKENNVETGKGVVIEKGKHIIVNKRKENVVDTGKPNNVETGKQNVVDAGKQSAVLDAGNQNIIDKGKQTIADTREQNAAGAGQQKALEEARAAGNNGDPTSKKRSRRTVWTSELHLKFTAALSTLGDHLANPKLIHEMMNVPHITQRQVASHFQKYKSQVQQIIEAAEEDSSASKKEKASLGRMETSKTDTSGFDYGASTSLFHALRDPFRFWKYDPFLYEELPRRVALMKAMQRPNLNHTHKNPVPASNLGGSNLKIRGTSDKQCIPEAEGTKVKGPELNLPKISPPLGAGAGDMDYFSDLAPIFSSDQLPTELNIDLGPQLGLTGRRTEQLSAVNRTQGMAGDLPKIASDMNPLQEALLKNGLSGEASEGHLQRSRGSIISNDFLMAFKDDVLMEDIMMEFEGEPKGLVDPENKTNLEDANKYAQWLEEYLEAPGEA